MRRTYIPYVIIALLLVNTSACRKKEIEKPVNQPPVTTEPTPPTPDYVLKMAGEWNCNGENNATHVAFSSASTWTVIDTALVLTNFTMKIEKVSDVRLQVICMGYDQYMAYTNLGISFDKCETASDSSKVEFRAANYDPYYGYGSGRRLTYYIRQDSIYYSADYKSNTDRFNVIVSGGRE